MKVFVRTSDLTGEKPVVIGFYPDSTDVSDDAHGREGVTVMTLPMNVIVRPADGGMPHLAEDWRQRAGAMPLEAEARRRMHEAFTPEERLEALRDLLEAIIKHGLDVSQWPAETRGRKVDLDEKWNYLGEVRERARGHAPTPPLDPRNDKVWPRRIAKK